MPPSAEWRPVLGPTGTLAGTDNELARLAGRAKAAGLLPRLRVDCGTDDFLLDDNRTFDRQCVAYPGGHDWTYRDEHVREAIDL